ncbi:MAG: hypothetical protein LBC77_08090 [Spirochaetaceae bacterium]|jgi:hypothetical protein|nr:hypothetical protein [Spirochaetaceae bacterium]
MPLKYSRPEYAALSVRSAALFAALFQYNLIAGELSDRPVFIAALLCAFFAGYTLARKNVKSIPAFLSLLLAPFAARFLIALPRMFSGVSLDISIALDAFLLNYDRNNLVVCLPFYYASITTFFAARRGKTGAYAFLDCALIAITFSLARSSDIKLYGLPVVLIAVFGIMLFLELCAMLLSISREYAVRKKENASALALLVLILLSGGVLLFFEEQKESFNENNGK